MNCRGAQASLALLFSLGLAAGCAHAPVEDLSSDAAASNDLTLVSSACQAAPGQGLDICRVNEGAAVAGDWLLVIPQGATTLGGELSADFRGVTQTYAVPPGAKTYSLPWRTFFSGEPVWTEPMGGIVMALLSLQWVDRQGVRQTTNFRGMVFLEVLKAGYSKLPIGSALKAWHSTCQIDYTTAGRSSVSCR
jgi:hypothetical protein